MSSFKESFEKTKIAGSIAAGALDEVAKIIKPGISTDEIDKVCYEFINDNKAYSAPLFYRGFPKSCCTSANHVVCHGIPSDKILKDGDIVNVDVTSFKDGWHGDTSRMFKIGEVSIKAEMLIQTTYEAMMKAIKIVKDGVFLGDIGLQFKNMLKLKDTQLFKIFVVMVLVKHFIKNLTYYIMEKKEQVKKLKKG